MTLSDIIFEMELGGVDNEHVSIIVNKYKEKPLLVTEIDDLLVEMGYSPIFSVDYDSYDEYDEFEESAYYEKSYHKRDWD